MPLAPSLTPRQSWMAALARSDRQLILRHLAEAPDLPEHTRLRGPEIGLVMLRGRAGGTGAAFNLGEMTVTRCTVQNALGLIGHAYVAGRDLAKAELAAALDAALQDAALGPALQETVIAPLTAALSEAAAATRAEADATRVEFFTLTTMRS